jgi:hypothetical protein
MSDTEIDFAGESSEKLTTLAYNFAAEAEKYKKLADDAKRELRKRLTITVAGRPHQFGRLRVKVAEYRRFDAKTAETNLSAAKFKKILVPVPSAELAKALVKSRVLTPDDYEACRKAYDNAITITVVEE